MAKALYSVIVYPESGDIEKAKQMILGSGGQYLLVLHSMDTKKDGSPAKPHYHLAIGWESGGLSWAKFVEFIKEFGGICPSDRRLYDPKSAKVHDPDQLVNYFEHKDKKSLANPRKMPYISESSEGWNVHDYITYEKRRGTAKSIRADERAERTAAVSEVFDYIRKNEVYEYSVLVDKLRVEGSELLSSVITDAYPITAYLRSRWQSEQVRQSSMEKELRSTVEELRRDLEYERNSRELVETENNKLRYLELRMYELLTGETAFHLSAIPIDELNALLEGFENKKH